MRLNDLEQQSIDVDWFFLCQNNIVFVASGGGKIPNSILENWDIVDRLSTFFRELSPMCEFILNPNLNQIIGSKVDNNYLRDFIFMAERGLFAFDKTYLNNFNDNSYHLVASPKTPLDFNLIPEALRKELQKTIYHAGLSESIDIKNIL